MASDDPVSIEREGALAVLRLDRPSGRNSFDVATLVRMRAAVQELVDDPAVRAVVLTGQGKTFCTGADLAEMRTHADAAPRLFDDLTLNYHALVQTMQRSGTAFVAAVNGVAAGGGVGLALSADLVVMARSARLVLAYGNLGVSPDGGATAHLVRAIGPHRAREALLVDEGIGAEQAHAWGLANRVVDDAELLDAAKALALKVAARSRHTVAAGKRLVALATHSPTDLVLEEERAEIITAAGTEDFQEGLRAFAEKRAPRFR